MFPLLWLSERKMSVCHPLWSLPPSASNTHQLGLTHTDHGSVPDIPFPTGTDADRRGSDRLIDPKVFFGRNKFMRKFPRCRSDIFVFCLVITESCRVLTSYRFWPNSVWDGARKERGRTVSQSEFNNEQIRWWLSATTTPASSSHQPTSCVHGHTHTHRLQYVTSITWHPTLLSTYRGVSPCDTERQQVALTSQVTMTNWTGNYRVSIG